MPSINYESTINYYLFSMSTKRYINIMHCQTSIDSEDQQNGELQQKTDEMIREIKVRAISAHLSFTIPQF